MSLKHGQYGSVEEEEGHSSSSSLSKLSSGPVESFTETRSVQLRTIARGVFIALCCVFLGFVAASLNDVLYKGRGFWKVANLGAARSDAATSTASYSYMSMSDEEQSALFADFVSHFGKTYSSDSEEYSTRLANFKVNLQVIDDRNEAEAAAMGEGIHGITKFSDLTQEEFESMNLLEFYEEDEYSGTDSDRRSMLERERRTKRRAVAASKQRELLEAKAIRVREWRMGREGDRGEKQRRKDQEVITSDSATVTNVDWSTSLTTAINDQGTGCRGASWAFTATQQIESDAIRKGYLTQSDALSVQQLLDCNTESNGCTSGSLESAYDYASKSNGGLIHSASQYPYINAVTPEGCSSADSDYATTLGSYATVTKYHNEEYGYTTTQVESNMLAHLASTGTLSACMDGSNWNTYVSGTMSSCVGSTINTCAQIVGVYYDPVSDTGYYKLRNSWGSDFGESGFIRLAHGVNACNIVYNPGYTDPASSLT